MIGHRGCGKTSLHEAMLFEAGAVQRLGTVAEGTTVSDHEPDEQERSLSINASLACFEHDGREINLIDTPGEPSFVADAIAALRVVDAAVVVVNGSAGSRSTPSGSGAAPTLRVWRGSSSSTCSTA
ncbi:MAG TPA: GTP-binding protein, partial [Solirubrobacterales bacterium]|nr:GTP-binding protein [Solirubrobacterales bacterium]